VGAVLRDSTELEEQPSGVGEVLEQVVEDEGVEGFVEGRNDLLGTPDVHGVVELPRPLGGGGVELDPRQARRACGAEQAAGATAAAAHVQHASERTWQLRDEVAALLRVVARRLLLHQVVDRQRR